MNKLLVALVANAFALMLGSALATDGDMTPAAKQRAYESPLWRTGDFHPKRGWADAKARKEATARERVEKKRQAASHKATNEEREKALTDQSKKGPGQ